MYGAYPREGALRVAAMIKISSVSKSFQVKVNRTILGRLLRPEYAYVKALKNVNLTIDQGDCVAYVEGQMVPAKAQRLNLSRD